MQPNRRELIERLLASLGIGLAATWPALAHAFDLSQADASAGVKAALDRGADAAVSVLGQHDGFLGNPKVRIALPSSLESVAKLLKATGQSKQLDELITAMNRAAEAAVPAAKPLLKQAIQQISVADASQIVRGGDTSVTEFFATKTRAPLTERFLPIVTQQTEKLSLAQQYNAIAGQALGFGMVKKDDANVQQYVTRKALDGLFFMIGEEERKIRKDPVGTGSAILKKVFGS